MKGVESCIVKGIMNPRTNFSRAIHFCQIHNYTKAEAYFLATFGSQPYYGLAHYQYASLLYDLERFDEARYHYEQCLKICPNNINARLAYADLLERFQDFPEKEQQYLQILKIDSTSIIALFEYANLLFALGKYKKAKKYYEKALLLNPKNPDINYQYISLLDKLSNYRLSNNFRKAVYTVFQIDLRKVFVVDSLDLNEINKNLRAVTLIYPRDRWKRYTYAALMGATEKDEDLKCRLRAHFVDDVDEAIARHSKERNATIVAYSLLTPEMPYLSQYILYLKKKYPSVLFIAGGPHASGAPADTLSIGFDLAFIGEGEITFPLFLKKLLAGKSYESLNGIAYKRNGAIVVNKSIEAVNLDDYLPYCSRYNYLYSPLELTRGCFFKCKYCQSGYFLGKLRHRNPDQVSAYCQKSIERGFTDLRFLAPDVFTYNASNFHEDNSEALHKFFEGLTGIPYKKRIFLGDFLSEARPDSINETRLRILATYVHNKVIKIGLQTGSERLLKYIHRGHTVEDVYRAVNLVKKYNFHPKVDIMLGLPTETRSDTKATLDVIKELIKQDVQIRCHTFMPLPGTPFFKEKPGIIREDVKRILYTYVEKGNMTGYWRIQEKLARDVYDYMHRTGSFRYFPKLLVVK